MILYLVKSTWAAVIISSILAIVAFFYAFKDFRITDRMAPITVIGLSAATITIVYVANALLAQIIIRSAYNSLGY